MQVYRVEYSGFGRDDDPFYSIELPIISNGDYFIDSGSVNRLDLSTDSLDYHKMTGYCYSFRLSIKDKNTLKVVVESIEVVKDYATTGIGMYLSTVNEMPLNKQKLSRLHLAESDTLGKNLGVLTCYDWGSKNYASIEYHDKYLQSIDIDIPIEFDEYLYVSGYCNLDNTCLVVQSINDYKVLDKQNNNFIGKQINLDELKLILDIITININVNSLSRRLFNKDDNYFLNCLNVYKDFKHMDCKAVSILKDYVLNYIDYIDD